MPRRRNRRRPITWYRPTRHRQLPQSGPQYLPPRRMRQQGVGESDRDRARGHGRTASTWRREPVRRSRRTGVRTLVLDDTTVAILWELWRTERRRLGRPPSGRVFRHRDGRPVRPDWLPRRLLRVGEGVGVAAGTAARCAPWLGAYRRRGRRGPEGDPARHSRLVRGELR